MGLTRITKGVIKPNEDYQTGIITATGIDVNGNADISGNLSVGGVLTYEDVTSIDSVGIITAQERYSRWCWCFNRRYRNSCDRRFCRFRCRRTYKFR